MELEQAKQQFVQLWGNFGTQWGINRSMAQVHALLLASPKSLCTEEVMENLSISRGNANTNLRELMNWNLIYKDFVQGDRREYFRAEKDVWEIAKRILKERKRREIEPLQQHLTEIRQIDATANDEEAAAFTKTLDDISRLVTRLDGMTETLLKADEHFVFGKLLSLLK